VTASRLLATLTYWPRQHLAGLACLWRECGPALAIGVTAANLFGMSRQFWVSVYGTTIEIRTPSPDLMVALDSFGDEFAPVLGLADPGGLIVDAGAYIGTAALKLSAAFPQSRVICLEPSAENRALLRRNVRGVANIEIWPQALAVADGAAPLRDPGSGAWGYSIVGDSPVVGEIETVSIATLLARAGAERIFLMKLDIEGAERELLAGAEDWIANVDILIAELHEGISPGTEAAFAAATAGRTNTRLPGEKVMSVRG
jgi:FkbM family methyltransferase